MKKTNVARGSPRSGLALKLLAPLVLFLAVAPFCCVRIPGDAFGVLTSVRGPKLLEAGSLASRFPWARLDLYPLAPIAVSGEASALSREGARQPIRFRFTARADSGRVSALPPRRQRGALPGVWADDLVILASGALEGGSAGEPIGMQAEDDALRLGRFLADSGLIVLSIETSRLEPLASPSAPAPTAVTARATKIDRPILLIGLDGADWQIIDPLIEAGKLPVIAGLKKRSAWGHMRAYEPVLSPLLWTTVATGKSPDEHGVIDFLVLDPVTGRRSPTTSRARKVRALWDIFSERGLSSLVVAWWASWPALPLNGWLVSDRVAYSLFDVEGTTRGLTWPESLWESLREEVVSADSIGYKEIAPFLDLTEAEYDAARLDAAATPGDEYREPVSHLAKILASTRTYHQMTLRLLRERQPDLSALYYQTIDEVSHRFMHFAAPKLAWVKGDDSRKYARAVEAIYRYQDALLGEVLAVAAKDSTVIVLSDHGFQNGPSRPTDGPADIEGKPGKWHRLYGIVMISGEGIRPGRLDSASLYDIAPTVLALAGLPLASDMKGEPLLRSAGSSAPSRVATYELTPPEPGAVAGASSDASPLNPKDSPDPHATQADEELMRNLASLGYIGAVEPSVERSSLTAVGTSPGSVTSHTNLGAVLLRKGDLPGAEHELRAALKLQSGYFPALMSLGQVLVREGRIAEALAVTREAIAGTEGVEEGTYVQLALLAARAGAGPESSAFLSAIENRRPRCPGIEVAQGVLASAAGDLKMAERRYRAALAMDPSSAEAMRSLFQLYRADHREAALLPEVRRGLAANDRSVLHHNWLGLILVRTGDLPGAEKSYRRALDLAPDFAGTMANLGGLYARSGRLQDAVGILSRAVRLEPRNLEARVNLGAALAKLGRLDESIASLNEARSMGVRSTEVLNALGLALAQTGNAGEAILRLEESLTLAPDQPKVKALLLELKRAV